MKKTIITILFFALVVSFNFANTIEEEILDFAHHLEFVELSSGVFVYLGNGYVMPNDNMVAIVVGMQNFNGYEILSNLEITVSQGENVYAIDMLSSKRKIVMPSGGFTAPLSLSSKQSCVYAFYLPITFDMRKPFKIVYKNNTSQRAYDYDVNNLPEGTNIPVPLL